MNETPKKISHDCECCIPCRGKFSAAKEKIRVFGKSSVDRCSLAYRATNVDLSVYVDREKLAICRTQCYNRIVRFNNALQKVDEISEEIRGYFGGNVSLRVKRMAKDNCNTLEAKKSLRPLLICMLRKPQLKSAIISLRVLELVHVLSSLVPSFLRRFQYKYLFHQTAKT